MKKLITLTNVKSGIVRNVVTGEVRKVDADENEKIKLPAKHIAELHNAGVEKLEEEDKEK